MSIAPTPVQEVWRPTLQRVATSEGGSGVAAARPSLPGVLPLGGYKAAAAASVLAAIPVPIAEVTLAAPSSAVAVEEMHGLSLPSDPKAPEESVAMMELGCPVASHVNEVVEILSDDEADLAARPPVSPRELMVSPRGPAVV